MQNASFRFIKQCMQRVDITRKPRSKIGRASSVIIWFMFSAALNPADAADNPMRSCEVAAAKAARDHQVPVDVLHAISRTETGRSWQGRFGPWAWTVNMEGRGHWFANRSIALEFVHNNMKRGARSFDVGCFQINYKWHHEGFASLEEMFDPGTNAAYAATYLKQLKQEMGSWEKAAGAYHSRTEKLALRYRKIFRAHLAEVRAANIAIQPKAIRKRPDVRSENRFELFSKELVHGSKGSLVGVSLAARQAFLRPSGMLVDFDR